MGLILVLVAVVFMAFNVTTDPNYTEYDDSDSYEVTATPTPAPTPTPTPAVTEKGNTNADAV